MKTEENSTSKPDGPSALAEAPCSATGWAYETMMAINRLTPEVKDKASDPDWFLLRQRLEQAETVMKACEYGNNVKARRALKTLDDMCHKPEKEWASKLSSAELADELIANLWAEYCFRDRKKMALLEAAIDRLLETTTTTAPTPALDVAVGEIFAITCIGGLHDNNEGQVRKYIRDVIEAYALKQVNVPIAPEEKTI